MKDIADGVAGLRHQGAQGLGVGFEAGVAPAQTVLDIFLRRSPEEVDKVIFQGSGGVNPEEQPVDAGHHTLPPHLQQRQPRIRPGGEAVQPGSMGIEQQRPGNHPDNQQHNDHIQKEGPPVNPELQKRKRISHPSPPSLKHH